MESNQLKSSITLSAYTPQEAQVAQQKFSFHSHQLEEGLKYRGFWIKPHGYKIVDWIWLMVKIEK